MAQISQRVRYVKSTDGTKLAWADAGSGPPLVRAANWLTHLEYDWESPVWRHWMEFLCSKFRFIRYDERGCGMTDRAVNDLSLDRWVEDLEAVIEAAGISEPFGLLGISQGSAACIAFAVKHPELVSRLVIYGGYSRGPFRRDDPKTEQMYRAMIDLIQVGWADRNPSFRQVFTSRFVPDATDEQLDWFNDLCKVTTEGEIAARLLSARGEVYVEHLLGEVKCPTLVLHARGDDVVPVMEGRIIAAGIPNAEYVELDSRNHVLLSHEPAWARFCEEVEQFFGLGRAAGPKDPAFSELTQRERQILALIAEGRSNADIADQLSISDKTVRNHVSNLFNKLGVWSRAQAIVFARDRGFDLS